MFTYDSSFDAFFYMNDSYKSLMLEFEITGGED